MVDSLRRCRVEEHRAPAVLAEHGLVMVAGIADFADLLRFAHSIAIVVSHRDSYPDGVTTCADPGSGYMRNGFAEFTGCVLNPHTSGSDAAHPPGLLMTSCRQPASTGGECTLADGQAIYDDLAQFSPDVRHWLPTLHAAIHRHTITFTLNAGDGYILNNHRWLHGRRAFTGRRVLHRIIGNPLPHLAIAPGFRPLRQLSPSAAV